MCRVLRDHLANAFRLLAKCEAAFDAVEMSGNDPESKNYILNLYKLSRFLKVTLNFANQHA